MEPTNATHKVLVVGAGPTGLTLASELFRHGVACRVVEKADRPNVHSRATDIQARTLEAMQDMGIVDRVLELGHPHRGAAMFADGRWLAKVRFDQLDTPFPYAIGLSQEVTERLLAEHLVKLGGKVERGVEVARVEPQSDGAVATLLHPDGKWEKVRYRWVVGCDGASSAVRMGLGLPFDGVSYTERFLMADVRLTWDEPNDNVCVFYGSETFAAILPLPGGIVRLFLDEPQGEELPITIETIRALFARCVPLKASLDDPGWMTHFRIHKRLVPKYRVGNVFLAGDAAHIHSPMTGQGMNLGIQDAYNLAWKLALVALGRAPDSLLDSYEPERRPLASLVSDDADKAQRRAMIKGRFGQVVRNNVLEILTRIPALTARLGEKNSQIGLGYRGSPIVGEERTSVFSTNLRQDRTTEHPSVGDWRDFDAAPAPGDRVPDVKLEKDTLFERLRGTTHTLLLFDGQAATSHGYENLARIADGATSRWGELVRPVVIVHGSKTPRELESSKATVWLDDGALHERFGAGSECLYLVRPDGHVGFRAQPATLEALERYLSRVLL